MCYYQKIMTNSWELEILYQDDDVVAINKPGGLLVHRRPVAAQEKIFVLQIVRDQMGCRDRFCQGENIQFFQDFSTASTMKITGEIRFIFLLNITPLYLIVFNKRIISPSVENNMI